MDKTKIVEIENLDGSFTEHVIIDHGDDRYTSMPKAVYDAMQDEAKAE